MNAARRPMVLGSPVLALYGDQLTTEVWDLLITGTVVSRRRHSNENGRPWLPMEMRAAALGVSA